MAKRFVRILMGSAAALSVTFAASAALANSTTSYGYDALGRLSSVTYVNGSSTYTVTYTYDAAGNRTAMTATGSPATTRVVVLPLLGGLVIPIH